MNTHLPGFQSFSGILHHFVLAKLATSSLRVKPESWETKYAEHDEECLSDKLLFPIMSLNECKIT